MDTELEGGQEPEAEGRLQVKCPACGRSYAILPHHAGKAFPCKICGKIVRIERVGQAALPAIQDPIEAPTARGSDLPNTAPWAPLVAAAGMLCGVGALGMVFAPIFWMTTIAWAAAGMALSIAGIAYTAQGRAPGLAMSIVGASTALVAFIIWLVLVVLLVNAISELERALRSFR